MTEISNEYRAAFDVYGYRFVIRTSARDPFNGICQDFAFFRSSPSEDDRIIEMLCEDPGYEHLPDCDAIRYTPRNVVFKAGDVNYIDYNGRGVGLHNLITGGFCIRSRDPDILYESVYLFLLSQCGKHLDSRGLHRIHALGLSIGGKAVLVLLPMGGGKSSLAHDLLRYPEVKLLSDDSPLVDRAGHIHAFPLHLGLLPCDASDVPEEHRRVIQRMEFGPKVLVNFEHFADRVSANAKPGLVFVGSRSLSRQCRIQRVGALVGLRGLLVNCIIGLGLFQGLEFILSRNPWELVSLFSLGASRLCCSLSLLRRSQVCRVWLGQDRSTNAKTILDYSKRCMQ